MARRRLRERCACGAEFEVEVEQQPDRDYAASTRAALGDTLSDRDLMQAWRTRHAKGCDKMLAIQIA